MTTHEPKYYRNLLNKILSEAAPSKQEIARRRFATIISRNQLPAWLGTAYAQNQVKFFLQPAWTNDKFSEAVAVAVHFYLDDDKIESIALEFYIAPPEKNCELIDSTAVIVFYDAIWQQSAEEGPENPKMKHLTDHTQSVLQHILQFPVGQLHDQRDAFDSADQYGGHWQLTSAALTDGLRSQLNHALGPLYGMAD